MDKLVDKRSSVFQETTLILDGVKIADPKVIVHEFNKYFVNIGKQSAESVSYSETPLHSFFQDSSDDYFALQLTDATDRISISFSLKNKKSSGYDSIPTNIMKLSIPSIADILAVIINSSSSNGIFPG